VTLALKWPAPGFAAASAADCERLLTLGKDGALRLWDAQARDRIAGAHPPPPPVASAHECICYVYYVVYIGCVYIIY